jgi:hypothetical protein
MFTQSKCCGALRIGAPDSLKCPGILTTIIKPAQHKCTCAQNVDISAQLRLLATLHVGLHSKAAVKTTETKLKVQCRV